MAEGPPLSYDEAVRIARETKQEVAFESGGLRGTLFVNEGGNIQARNPAVTPEGEPSGSQFELSTGDDILPGPQQVIRPKR
ncbi:hypothetical protein HY407_01870 [Candidatus Gottesmanbacteria bacterium]|nr:hypothetical protein [Candidatus Gottesmanbacteria bacterium]